MLELMTTPQDDLDRISKAQEGDRTAFGDLASRHRGRVEGLLRSRVKGSLQEADMEDLLQETFLRAFKLLDRFEWRGSDSFFNWLSEIALNVLLEAEKQRKRSPAASLEVDLPSRRRPSSMRDHIRWNSSSIRGPIRPAAAFRGFRRVSSKCGLPEGAFGAT